LKGQYLLDTNTALVALTNPDQMSAAAQAAILAGRSVLSAVSYWEVVLKSMKGNLDVGDPRLWWNQAIEELAALPLPLRAEHISAVCDLPSPHRDPFDRVLIAQAIVENLTFVTRHKKITHYASARLKVVSW
jgi:PIN domain nuclease of toxin-antitoxin system